MSQRKKRTTGIFPLVIYIIATNQQGCLLWEVDCIQTWLPIDGEPLTCSSWLVFNVKVSQQGKKVLNFKWSLFHLGLSVIACHKYKMDIFLGILKDNTLRLPLRMYAFDLYIFIHIVIGWVDWLVVLSWISDKKNNSNSWHFGQFGVHCSVYAKSYQPTK